MAVSPHKNELGLALLSGRAGPGWAARTARLKPVLKAILGDAPPPGLPMMPISARGRFLGAPPGPKRAKAVAAAAQLVEALADGSVAPLDALLEETVLVLWPNGAFLQHPKEALLAELSKRASSGAPIQTSKPRSYALSELRSVLARGLPEALDAVLRVRAGLAVSFELDSVRGSLGRILIVMSEDDQGGWRARNLLLASPDDAFCASIPAIQAEDPLLRLADQVVRAIVLGHATWIRSARGMFMDQLWVRDRRMAPEELATLVAEGPHRLASAQTVFLGARLEPTKKLDSFAPSGVMQALKQQALNSFGRSFISLAPSFVLVRLGGLDPSSGEIRPVQEAGVLLFRVPEEAIEDKRLRVGAVFI